MMRALPWMLVSMVLAACSGGPRRIDSQVLDAEMARSPDRFIIAAVVNDPSAFAARAGGTPRGYDIISAYGPSPEAQRVMHAVEKQYGLREVNSWPIPPLGIHCAVLEIPAGANRETLLATLQRDSRIKLTEPLQSFATRTDPYNDPYLDLQRGFQMMDIAGAHPYSRGDGVRIAIVDTGVDTDHPDLHANIAAAANFVDADPERFKRDRHGTEMAGVIAAVANNQEGIVGVAPKARLLVYKACWQLDANADAAHCNSFTLARAIAAAFDAHAQIVNLSIAGPDDRLLGDLIREGQRRGVLFVGAADDDIGLTRLPGIIEVASAEMPSTAARTVSAPGNEILTLLPGGHYDFASGVSIATAQVSGVVALMLARSPSLTADAVYALLRDSAVGQGVDACTIMVTVMQHGGSCQPTENRLAAPRSLPQEHMAQH